eukprot:4074-Heterococcus_DN1.PRE.4
MVNPRTLYRYKVVCADGALVREGPSLSSAQVQELPQHSIIEVHSLPLKHYYRDTAHALQQRGSQ